MNTNLLPLVTAAAVLAAAFGWVVWWQQRRRLAGLRRQLDNAERSRAQLADLTTGLQQQFDELGQSQPSQASQASPASPNSAKAPATDLLERRAALELALERALDAALPPAGRWHDTLPVADRAPVAPFALTEPPPEYHRPVH